MQKSGELTKMLKAARKVSDSTVERRLAEAGLAWRRRRIPSARGFRLKNQIEKNAIGKGEEKIGKE